jgi:protein-arginine deiminase
MRKLGNWIPLLCLAALAGCSDDDGGGGKEPTSVIDIRADVNRNGRVELDVDSEDELEAEWSAEFGAVFLANIDDDEDVCPNGPAISDQELAACFDAADEHVNGEADLLDLARILTVPWPEAPADASGVLSVSSPMGADIWQFVRLFKNNGGVWDVLPPDYPIPQAELQSGIELAIEAKDIVRDRELWDGFVDVKLSVDAGTSTSGRKLPDGEDVVRLRVAPLLFTHHLQEGREVYATTVNWQGSAPFRADLRSAAEAAGVPLGLRELQAGDVWTQDFMEIGYMSMPSEDGQHSIDVYVRSTDFRGDKDANGLNVIRRAGRQVYEFHGPDVAGFTPDFQTGKGDANSLDAYGNLEMIPPYEHAGQSYPLGRLFRGSIPSFHPDASFVRMTDAQLAQPPVYADTSWLVVGHIDETISFVKMDNARGWGVAVNDVTLAKTMLEDLVAQGHGGALMFAGKWTWSQKDEYVPAQRTISDVLADTELMAASAEAVTEVDAQLEILKAETGVTDAELIPVPFLHEKAWGFSIAYQPGTVNGIYLMHGAFGVPTPHGPSINGQDPFRTQLQEAFGKHGIDIHYIENWDLYHIGYGEVHCGSNTLRTLPAELWWESGR